MITNGTRLTFTSALLRCGMVASFVVTQLMALAPPAPAGDAGARFTIGPIVPFAVGFGAGPQSFALKDMNHDSLVDIVTVEQITGSVAVLLNQGDGSFAAPQSVLLDVFPNALAVADLDRDGNLDIAVTDDDGGLSLLFGSASGAVQLTDQLDPGLELAGVVAADLDEDGAIDLALLEVCDEIVLQQNLGNGSFDCFDEDLLETGSFDPIGIASGDVNGDSHVDLIVLNRIAENVALFLGNGDGTFRPSQLIAVGSSPRGLAVGRVDGDLRDDVVVVEAGFFDDNVTVLLGDAERGLRPTDKSLASVNATSIALADFNGDHCLDFVSPSLEESVCAIGLGDCSGRFAPPIASPALGFGRAVAVGDIDGDQRSDFVVLDEDGEMLSSAINHTSFPCVGDCDASGDVTVGDLVTGVNIALGRAAVEGCRTVDANGDGRVSVDELVRAVNNLLRGCVMER